MTRRRILAGLALTLGLLTAGDRAHAQDFSVTITFDEDGRGLFTNTNGFRSPLSFSLVSDTGPGGLASVLSYNLQGPPGLTAGDLILLEPGGGLSDLIRFDPDLNGGSLLFYSDDADGADSLADVGFPSAFSTNTFTLTEVGPEGDNGISYTPTVGQPGFVTGADGPVTYVIRSDISAVPEPSTLLLGLVGIGLAGLGFARRRRRAAA